MQWRAWAQLVRLPNIFTAVSDALLGTIAAAMIVSQPRASAALIIASAALYSAGMVWNDYFDRAIDWRERPFRPLPSGRISPRAALVFGVILLFAGAAFAAVAGWQDDSWRSEPFLLSLVLIGAILAYDGILKNTPVGPIAMGSCRFLNIYLATALNQGTLASAERFHLALVIGLYITGVTWFARREVEQSSPVWLRAAAALMLLSSFLALSVAVHRPENSVPVVFPYLITAFVFLMGFPVVRAIRRPDSNHVQAAVKFSVLGLILLDAILATAYIGLGGLLLTILLLPAYWLGRFLYST